MVALGRGLFLMSEVTVYGVDLDLAPRGAARAGSLGFVHSNCMKVDQTLGKLN